MSRSTPHSTNQALHFTLYTLHSAHYTFALYTLHFTLYTPHSRFTLRTPQSPLHSLLTTFPLYYLLNTSLFLVYSSHSTLCTPPHSTLHSVHWYGNREGMYNTVEITCFAMFRKSILRDCIRVCWLVLFRMRPKDFGNLLRSWLCESITWESTSTKKIGNKQPKPQIANCRKFTRAHGTRLNKEN